MSCTTTDWMKRRRGINMRLNKKYGPRAKSEIKILAMGYHVASAKLVDDLQQTRKMKPRNQREQQ